MPQYIIKIKDYYLDWSTIVDAPLTYGMSLAEYKTFYQRRFGSEAMPQLAARLQRSERYGSSAMPPQSAEQITSFNRAGPNEACLTFEGIYRHYCLGEPIQPEWIVPPDDDDEVA